MKAIYRNILILLGLLLLLVLKESLFIVDETEQVVITQFGESIGSPITEPGIHLKTPFIQKVNSFAKNILEWDGENGQVPTKDKTYIWVDVFGRWRISDALKFFKKVNNESSAHRTLDGIIDAAVRNLVTSYNLIETVRITNRILPNESWDTDDSLLAEGTDSAVYFLELGRSRMRDKIIEQASHKLNEFGIQLVDVRFKRIHYVDEVQQKVYERMIKERKQIAEKYRSEGRGESQKISGMKERELKKIYSEAYKESQRIKGEADAKATRIYAAAYNRDPEFYSFVKTLDTYKTSLDSTTWAVFSTKADFLKYLKQYTPAR